MKGARTTSVDTWDLSDKNKKTGIKPLKVHGKMKMKEKAQPRRKRRKIDTQSHGIPDGLGVELDATISRYSVPHAYSHGA